MHDINVGDTVYINKRIVTGFSQYEYFQIPKQVTRTTKTQFEAGGIKYSKRDLYQVGSRGYRDKCYLEGTDQTEQMKEFLINKKRVSDLRDLVVLLEKKIRGRGYHLPAQSLESISQAITEFLKIEEDYERFEKI